VLELRKVAPPAPASRTPTTWGSAPATRTPSATAAPPKPSPCGRWPLPGLSRAALQP